MFGAVPDSNLSPKRPSVSSRGSALARQVLGRAVFGGITKSVPAIESSVPIVGGHANWNFEVVGSPRVAEVPEGCGLVVEIGFVSDILGDKVLR